MPESVKGMRLNKGEWAEFYVMLKLLGEGRLYAANDLLKKNYKNYLDVLRVIREEIKANVIEYVIDEPTKTVFVIERNTGKVLAEAPESLFNAYADMLFEDLQNKKGLSVEAPDKVCEFADFIYVTKPKSPPVKALSVQFGGKNDIIIQVRDSKTSIVSTMGFSIKSKFASDPTLFNAGSSSQYLYKLSNCNDAKMDEFNSIKEGEQRGWGRCKTFLKANGINAEFVRTSSPVYQENLFLIRDSMPQIMAWCVKDRLLESDSDHKVKETIQRLIKSNPMNVSNPEVFYEKVMKDFLMAGFTGMTAGRKWDGKEQVNGGYIVVMEEGDVLCFHSSDREAFRDYLYRNTHFEYVSTKKYIWGYIEKHEDGYYLPLNISIRFNSSTR